MSGLAHPWLLGAAALVLPALWLGRRAPALRFAPAALGSLPGSWRTALRALPRALTALAVACAVVALARPVERRLLPSTSEGIDIVLCLDVSSSMAAGDMDGRRTRLDVARDAAAAFIRERPHDRIGLVSFARYADLRCPPTLDHDALLRLLDDVAIVSGGDLEDATGIGTAVARAAQVLERGGPRSRVAILLTDGEENVALAGRRGEIAPLHAAQLCETLRVRVHAVAVGARESRDTRPIEAVAARTGGAFFEAADAGAMGAVYESVDRMETTLFERARLETEERFLPFLLAALGLHVLARLLGATLLETLP